MKADIDKIRELLDLIENKGDKAAEEPFKRSFELFEMPEIIAFVVDYLQPVLTTYEAVFYWYLFRHSIIETGNVYVRVSIRGMTKGVVLSSSGKSLKLCQKTVQKTLAGLVEKGVVQQAGDTNREGTLYRIFLPEEIELCQERMKEIQKKKLPEIEPKKELDFYNIKENRQKVFKRDSYKPRYCGKQVTRFSATLDHIHPVSEGGDSSYDNLITSCLQCNASKGTRPVMDFIAEKIKVSTDDNS